MRPIIHSQLWLGHAGDVRNLRHLHDAGIAAIVDLAAEEPVPMLSRELVYCRFPLVDGVGNDPALLSAAIQTTAALIRGGLPLLVACGAGLSRSPCILAASLARVRGESPDAVLRELLAGQPHDVMPGLWSEVKAAVVGMG